jgi:hypothetical protein
LSGLGKFIGVAVLLLIGAVTLRRRLPHSYED